MLQVDLIKKYPLRILSSSHKIERGVLIIRKLLYLRKTYVDKKLTLTITLALNPAALISLLLNLTVSNKPLGFAVNCLFFIKFNLPYNGLYKPQKHVFKCYFGPALVGAVLSNSLCVE